MRTLKIFILLISIPIFFTSCSKDDEKEIPDPCVNYLNSIDFSFGIDYDSPDKYLTPGEQSDLSDSHLEEVRDAIGTPEKNIDGILQVCHWVNQNFTFENAGGNMVGKLTVDEHFEIKTFYGCHSAALIISSILREFGFPAVMIETSDVQWGYDYNEGTAQYFAGHVMSEIFVNNKWVLLDNNCTYVNDYDKNNPFIDTNRDKGLFVFAKGVDFWEYSSHDEINFTHDEMIKFSENINCYEEMFNTVNYNWSN
ncbi:MAG: hypothetical protein ABFR62_06125 [Bacteroidota bacterium]